MVWVMKTQQNLIVSPWRTKNQKKNIFSQVGWKVRTRRYVSDLEKAIVSVRSGRVTILTSMSLLFVKKCNKTIILTVITRWIISSFQIIFGKVTKNLCKLAQQGATRSRLPKSWRPRPSSSSVPIPKSPRRGRGGPPLPRSIQAEALCFANSKMRRISSRLSAWWRRESSQSHLLRCFWAMSSLTRLQGWPLQTVSKRVCPLSNQWLGNHRYGAFNYCTLHRYCRYFLAGKRGRGIGEGKYVWKH